MDDLNIAVLIPCYNEEKTIGKVVGDFACALPSANIFVYDNNSTDKTSKVAHEAGAIVRTEVLQGKGNVVRRMFADIEADIYLLVDGDGTYEASRAVDLVQILVQGPYDMVNAERRETNARAYRTGHKFGNWMLSALVAFFFGKRLNDILSGYRVFSRRFVKSFPALSFGFEIETELTVHALELRMPVVEVPTLYRERSPGSYSKLNSFRDGLRILRTIVCMVKEEKPLKFFSLMAIVLATVSLALAWPLFMTYFETGLVPRFPTAILCSAMMILAVLSFFSGLILDSIALGRREQKRMWYLQIPSIYEYKSIL